MPIWKTCSTRKLTGFARRFMRRCDGAVAVYMGFAAAMFIGFSALWVDLGRVFTMQSELQSAADSAALAGAAELIGTAGSINRATIAAEGAVGPPAVSALTANRQTFDTANNAIGIAQVRFFSSLPTDDTPIDSSFETSVDGLARFIEVTVQTGTSQNFFIPVLGGPTTSQTTAVAVAGFKRVICRIPPLAFCNPNEIDPPAGGGPGADFPSAQYIGTQLLAKRVGGGGASWEPGFFGLLDSPTGGQGTPSLADMLANIDPDSGCFSDTVDVKPGEVTSLYTAFNTRFDMYEAPGFKDNKTTAAYAPAPNVVKGKKPGTGTCKLDDPDPTVSPAQAMKFPRDSNLSDANRFGNGTWDRAAYWAVNQGGDFPPNQAQYTETLVGPTLTSSSTRWDFYNWEINNHMIPGSSTWTAHQTNLQSLIDGGATISKASTLEVGTPSCSTQAPAATGALRRTLVVAVINCVQYDVHGNSSNYPDNKVPVLKYFRMFMTEPMTAPGPTETSGDLTLEFAEEIGADTLDTVIHDMVQLYR